MAVVQILRAQTGRGGVVIHLLRCLSFSPLCTFLVHTIQRWTLCPGTICHYSSLSFHRSPTGPFRPTPSASGHTDARMGLTGLDRHVSSLFQQGVSRATLASYSSGQRKYLDFCSIFGLTPFLWILIPFVALLLFVSIWSCIFIYPTLPQRSSLPSNFRWHDRSFHRRQPNVDICTTRG